MFEARVCLKVEGETAEYICDIEMLKRFIPNLVEAKVLVESGGEGQPKGSSKMTLRNWNKENDYHARYVPLTSRPKSE